MQPIKLPESADRSLIPYSVETVQGKGYQTPKRRKSQVTSEKISEYCQLFSANKLASSSSEFTRMSASSGQEKAPLGSTCTVAISAARPTCKS